MPSSQSQTRVPTWILAYAGFLILLGFGAGALGLFSPQNIFLNVQVDYALITAITAMFAVRNVALGTIAAYALWRRDPKYLLMVFIARFVVETGDLIITLSTNLVTASPLLVMVVWTAVFLAPQFLSILSLYRLAHERA